MSGPGAAPDAVPDAVPDAISDAAPDAAPDAVPDAERLARAALTRVAEPDDYGVRMLVRQAGPVDAWRAIRDRDPSLPDPVLARTRARVAGVRPERDLAHVARLGGRFVCPGDAEWPDRLAGLEHLPDPRRAQEAIGLWVRGPLRLDESTDRSVAVVGSRAATAYGCHVTGEMAAALADRGWTVVSGGAHGIDAAAHRGSLAAGGRTVAVLAGGIDYPYPRGNERLLARIAETGLLVSEWPPGSSPMKHRFLTRNRVIAALGRGTVVVEAALRSGALNTVRWGRELGRTIMAVPGPVTSPLSGGCHQQLREPDTVCVTCAAEVVEAVGSIGDDLAPHVPGPPRRRDRLGPQAQRVIDALPSRRATGPDDIAREAGLPVHRVVALLDELEDAGWVEHCSGGFRLGDVGRLDARSPDAREVDPV